jgi:flagellar biosynthetic protein FliP
MRGRGVVGVVVALALLVAGAAQAQGRGPVQISFGGEGDAGYLRLVLLFASVSLAPALLAVVTSFARIVVVLFFLRAGLGSQQLIPNPVLIGLALLLTVVTMAGPLQQVNTRALQPLLAGRIALPAAWEAAQAPARQFFSAHVRTEDLQLFQGFARAEADATPTLPALAAAYAISELRAAFIIGFVIFLPFLVIDLVVAGTLATLGLGTMPAAVLALPFKVLLFVMVDGWRLLCYALLSSLQ